MLWERSCRWVQQRILWVLVGFFLGQSITESMCLQGTVLGVFSIDRRVIAWDGDSINPLGVTHLEDTGASRENLEENHIGMRIGGRFRLGG